MQKRISFLTDSILIRIFVEFKVYLYHACAVFIMNLHRDRETIQKPDGFVWLIPVLLKPRPVIETPSAIHVIML